MGRQLSRGSTTEPLYPEDARLSLDELQHRTYYRVKKVLELNGAGYGLEPWSGLNWLINGFYDCMMIGEGFYAGNYTEPKRAIVFLANRTEQAGTFAVRIDPSRLPKVGGSWHARYCLGREGDIGPLGDGQLRIDLPALHDGPIGIELLARP